jgi:hypothetical protein
MQPPFPLHFQRRGMVRVPIPPEPPGDPLCRSHEDFYYFAGMNVRPVELEHEVPPATMNHELRHRATSRSSFQPNPREAVHRKLGV